VFVKTGDNEDKEIERNLRAEPVEQLPALFGLIARNLLPRSTRGTTRCTTGLSSTTNSDGSLDSAITLLRRRRTQQVQRRVLRTDAFRAATDAITPFTATIVTMALRAPEVTVTRGAFSAGRGRDCIVLPTEIPRATVIWIDLI
jgi:hypothetical protein